MNQQIKIDLQIIDELLKHARGKLCSRYVLGLGRAYDSLKIQDAKPALQEQYAWAKARNKSRKKK